MFDEFIKRMQKMLSQIKPILVVEEVEMPEWIIWVKKKDFR